MGRLIVLEGLDGSGKATQAGILAERAAKRGEEARLISFPDYASPSSALVRMYLDGEFGEKPDDVSAYAASAFYAVDRYASFQRDWGSFYMAGGLVVADRYTTSNAVHQCSKLPQEEWEAYTAWLFDFEYDKLALPRPDMVLYLDVEPDVAGALLHKRYDGKEGMKDIHEADEAYLERSRLAAQWCAARFGWRTVRCVTDGRMRSVEEIASEVESMVLEGKQ